MARIRTVKPEFWTSEQVVECSTNARLLFIGLWNFCDDQGIHPASLKRIKMEIFPGDNYSQNDLKAWVDELIAQDLLRLYVNEDGAFLQVTGWHHQKIDKPSHKYQPPQNSTTFLRTLDECSTTAHPRKVKESNGRDHKENAYAFQGETVKINHEDYEKLSKQYPNLDLQYQLNQLDLELKGKKNWFVEMNSKLNYRNRTPAHHKQQTQGEYIQ